MNLLVEKLYLLLRCVAAGAVFLLLTAGLVMAAQKWLKKSGHICFLYFFMLFSGVGAAFIFLAGVVITLLSFDIFADFWTFYFTGWKFASGTLDSSCVIVFGAVWLMGMIVSGFFNVRDQRTLASLCRMNQPVTDIQMQNCFYRTAMESGIRNIPLLFCNEAVRVPFLKGIRCPEIVLPAVSLRPGEQMLVFAHELTHHKHHDLFFRYLMKIVFAVYWFFPFHSCWMEKFIELQETLCDIDVCRNYGENFSAGMYYTAILSLSGGKRNFPESSWSVSDLCEHTSQLERRVRNMIGYRTGTRRNGAVSVLSLMGSTVFLITVFGIMFWPNVFINREQVIEEIHSFPEMYETVLSGGRKERTEELKTEMTEADEILQWDRLLSYTLKPGQQICSETFQGVRGENLVLIIAAAFSGYEVVLMNRDEAVYSARMEDDVSSLNLRMENLEYRLYIRNTGEKDLHMELFCTR